MEGSGYFRLSRDIEEGPHQNEENKKWRGPVTAGLIEKLAWDPTRIRKLESGGVR